ncbi:AAA family ATPase [Planktothrix agardhii 1806]|uniref:McrB family protein n=1 Tax=Planktothrix agardhii TaxID=1160 RepID=UPI001F36214F|nr:AAA family ATPase [Planktothrix agardhii]MCF3604079.1 AAA family ATPase [Planktothrix agardhii 1804]MCF3618539.1 AAA family ATPase [Planktothrix agardhii 1806]
MSNIQSKFTELFLEFIDSYPYSGGGLRHIAAYDQQRQQGCRNFKAIISAANAGEDVTDSILLQLLPYTDSSANRKRGAWINISPALATDVRNKFEASKWTKSEEWPDIAQAILNFVRCCNDDPNKLIDACNNFSNLPYSKGFQSGMISPILNALRPDNFILINKKSRIVINYFAQTSYTQQLIDYPDINNTGIKLIKKLAPEMRQPGRPALRDDDLFDRFSHWLVAVKKYHFNSLELPFFGEIFMTDIKSDIEEQNLQPEYTLDQCSEETGIDQTELLRWVNNINRKGQIILQGPPGTGKTFIAKQLAEHFTRGKDGFSEIIQFHPSYSYEDFIQGIRPRTENGQLTYDLVPGRFLEFCKKAESYDDICVLIIDEINRANLSNVFGELMYLLEYRDQEINLAGSNESFKIPENVRIIGTMNTADRSIALVDHALRRRFAFIKIAPNYTLLKHYYDIPMIDQLIPVLQDINKMINDPNYEIGISFFMIRNIEDHLQDIWEMEIEPYLEEYFYNAMDKIDQFRWNQVKIKLGLNADEND